MSIVERVQQIDRLIVACRFRIFFKADLMPPTFCSKPSNTRLRFTPAEDDLLALGLYRFGDKSFEQIQRTLLPTKSVKQLHNRFKNRSCTRAPDNPIKVMVSLAFPVWCDNWNRVTSRARRCVRNGHIKKTSFFSLE